MAAIVERYLDLKDKFGKKRYLNSKGSPSSISDLFDVEKTYDGIVIGSEPEVTRGAGLKSYGAKVQLNEKLEMVLAEVQFKADRKGFIPEAMLDVADTLEQGGYGVTVGTYKNTYNDEVPNVVGMKDHIKVSVYPEGGHWVFGLMALPETEGDPKHEMAFLHYEYELKPEDAKIVEDIWNVLSDRNDKK